VVARDMVLAVRAPGWLTSYAIVDGARTWEAALDDAWPVAVAATTDLALARTANGSVTAHGLDGGEQLWRHRLDAGPRAGRPYSRAPGGLRVPLLVLDGFVWTGEFDALVALDLANGDIVRRSGAGAEIATVVADGSQVLAVTVDGSAVTASSR
jgi:hypothetical protein